MTVGGFKNIAAKYVIGNIPSGLYKLVYLYGFLVLKKKLREANKETNFTDFTANKNQLTNKLKAMLF